MRGLEAIVVILAAVLAMQITDFWEVSTFILNSALFVLVGIQTPAIVSVISFVSLGHAVVTALLVGGVVIATRLLWLYSVPYLLRAVDRRPSSARCAPAPGNGSLSPGAGCAGPCRWRPPSVSRPPWPRAGRLGDTACWCSPPWPSSWSRWSSRARPCPR